MSANVLVFTPTYQENGADKIRRETLDSIDNLEGSFNFILGRFNPFNAGYENILNQYKTARELVLMGDYDYLMTIEHDMIIPSNALSLLLSIGAPVAYGVYLLRHGANKVLNTWRRTSGSSVGMSLSLFPDELKKAEREVTPEIAGVGFGCTLIKRYVLELLDFHGHGRSSIPDVPFSNDCIRSGISQRAHFGVKCGHIEPSGRVLWPFDKGDKVMNMIKVKVLQDFNGAVGTLTVKFSAGDEVELPEATAKEFERAGYVASVSKTSKRKASTKSVTPKKVAKPLTTKSLKGEESDD